MSTGVLVALVITLAVEVPIVAFVYRRPRGQPGRMAVIAALTTGVSNLAMNTLWMRAAGSREAFLLGGELAATAVEAVIYALADPRRDVGRALVASGLANAASFAAGLLIFG